MKTMFIIGVNTPGGNWMAEGLFTLEAEAITNCTNEEMFIIEVPVGKRFPAQAIDAINMWWPKNEKKEDSYVYKRRQREEE